MARLVNVTCLILSTLVSVNVFSLGVLHSMELHRIIDSTLPLECTISQCDIIELCNTQSCNVFAIFDLQAQFHGTTKVNYSGLILNATSVCERFDHGINTIQCWYDYLGIQELTLKPNNPRLTYVIASDVVVICIFFAISLLAITPLVLIVVDAIRNKCRGAATQTQTTIPIPLVYQQLPSQQHV